MDEQKSIECLVDICTELKQLSGRIFMIMDNCSSHKVLGPIDVKIEMWVIHGINVIHIVNMWCCHPTLPHSSTSGPGHHYPGEGEIPCLVSQVAPTPLPPCNCEVQSKPSQGGQLPRWWRSRMKPPCMALSHPTVEASGTWQRFGLLSNLNTSPTTASELALCWRHGQQHQE